jgi:23S rRNA (adenine2030-N6)-methyltransferase
MFSYRHAYHAGNHADVLKHTVLIAIVQYMTQKEVGFTVIDTHAGAGIYRLDSDAAELSGEVDEGLRQLLKSAAEKGLELDELLGEYVQELERFNPSGSLKVYPGSPLIAHDYLRRHDKLKVFELHPTDSRMLIKHIEQLRAGRQINCYSEDGFEGLKKLLPPPTRRGLVLMDPSYEMKSDYARVVSSVQDSLKRFVTGTYMVWYPVIARPEAHDLPRRLKVLAQESGKPWVHATLRIKSGQMGSQLDVLGTNNAPKRPGLAASGVFIINPPHTLKPQLKSSLPQMVELMGQDALAGFTLDSGS